MDIVIHMTRSIWITSNAMIFYNQYALVELCLQTFRKELLWFYIEQRNVISQELNYG
jgi:hypothetical protein